MLSKRFFISLALLLAAAFIAGVWTTSALAQQGTGGENFVFVNYIGQELTLDLDDTTYIIPGADTMPQGGRLALQLAPGEHKFAANVPGVGLGFAGEFMITPGQVVGKAAIIEQTSPSVDRNGILLAAPKDKVKVFDFDPLAPPATEEPVVDTFQPAPAATGQASLVWVNYLGDELTVDLSGQLYKVAPAANNIPGRLQINVAPGDYTYTASVPAGSINGVITPLVGQVTGLNIFADPLKEREYEVGEEYEFIQPLTLRVQTEDLTGQTAVITQPATTETVPATLPATGGELGPLADESPLTEGLLIKNYAGDTLTFTINNQAYTLPNNQQLSVTLPPGFYTYTASLPFVATTGAVDMQPGQSIQLSVAINVAHDVLSVYQN